MAMGLDIAVSERFLCVRRAQSRRAARRHSREPARAGPQPIKSKGNSMQQKMDYEAQHAMFRAEKMLALFGPAPLLQIEPTDVYKKMLAGLGEDFAPRSTAEMMLVRDLADISVEIFRYRLFKVGLLESRIFKERNARLGKATARAEVTRPSCFEPESNEPLTKAERAIELAVIAIDGVGEVDEILAARETQAKYMEPLQLFLNKIETIEVLESRKVAQRDRILRQLEKFKEGWGGHLHRVFGRLEREYSEEYYKKNPQARPQSVEVPLSEIFDHVISEKDSGQSD
jgi:hypothetical protein